MNGPKKYSRKPTVVKAIRYESPDQPSTSGNITEIQEMGCHVEPEVPWDPPTYADLRIFNSSHDDWNLVRPGDWIVEGVSGEFYPIENEIFEATYEEVG